MEIQNKFNECLKNGDYAKAFDMLDELQSVESERDFLLKKSFVLFQMGKAEEAKTILINSEKLCGSIFFYHQLSGEIAFKQKEYQSAIKWFNKALKLSPPAAQEERIQFFLKKLQELCSRKNSHKEIETAFQNKNYEECLHLAKEHLKSNPLDASVMEMMALCAYLTGDLEHAETALEELTHLEPTRHLHYYHLGLTKADRKDARGAVIALKQSIQINPVFQKAYYALAQLYESCGSGSDAIALYREILILDPFSEVSSTVLENHPDLSIV
jgi:tetratricopeptide (TPR) repeat protein